ncbi:aminoglycoside phosphotransferase family protein [Mucilaginibacter daejeonensis]|uniref:phosphotransferase enzyme family protein n=1 Tax=Mucilaginibacter daejeonensis TaxID=398049 RepID=UPI001D1785C3|nr:aminoglycoside phosphotransferase family protein [Mucilaginibacter daejeonensis]UEG54983.1 aminoglycoside phosphotransferase family protein [Mucilaginibacter daejeonensis]
MQAPLRSVDTLKKVTGHFKISGQVANIYAYGSGHINDTYRVVNVDTDKPDHLLQCINSYVFKDVPLLINNIRIVTGHIRQKLQQVPGANADQEVLTLITTKDDQYFYMDEDGVYWRMYLFIKDTLSYDQVTTARQACEGGKGFGKFQSMLTDLDANLLGETIADFHNIEWRFKNFDQALSANAMGRAEGATKEIKMVNARREQMAAIMNMGRRGELPLRITHNDTKFNNVLLDKNDQAQCVIDLDTVMPGYIAYDFGDAIRTIVNTAAEDEADLSKIDVDLELFEAFTQGFLQDTAKALTEAEISSLALGALLLPFIVGLRFLTDHLDGDKYFKIRFPDHNLQRARAQLRLTERLEEKFTELQQIIAAAAQRYRTEMLINH